MLATNTSSLSVAQMAADLDHPERVVGFHFFNPVAVMPLVEIVRGPATDDDTLATAFAIAKTLKKNAVLVKDATGFVVNRLLLRLLAEIFAAVDEGTPVEVADAALRPLGFPMSPYALLQLVGPAVTLHVLENLHSAFGDRFPVSPNLRALVASERPGIYDWTPDGEPYVSERDGETVQGRQPAEHRRTGTGAGVERSGRGDRSHAGRRSGRSADGYRSVLDPRWRLAVPPRRHYAISRPGSGGPPFLPTEPCPRAKPLLQRRVLGLVRSPD